MEIIQTLTGFFIATLGIFCGYLLNKYLPDERADVEHIFSIIKHPFMYAAILSMISAFYPQPITAALLFIFLIPTGIVVREKIIWLWLLSFVAFNAFFLISQL